MNAKARENKPSCISKGNVIDDLGSSPEQAAAVKLKASLNAEILRVVEKRKLKARLPGYPFCTFLQKLSVYLQDFNEGRYQSYMDLMMAHYIAPVSR